MCECIPSRYLPPREAIPEPGVLPRPTRRTLLAGLGGLVLAGCVPVRAPRRPALAARRPCPPAPRRTTPPYRVIPRAAWGAAPLRANHDPMGAITRITLHHTAKLPGMDTRTDAELVRGIQAFHQDGRGWADIGYHWVLGRDGNVYQGRSTAVQGAHAGAGHNGHNLGISVIGDFDAHLPTPRVLRTLRLFLGSRMRRYGIPPARVYGHRDFKPTDCPGDRLYAWLGRFKAARPA